MLVIDFFLWRCKQGILYSAHLPDSQSNVITELSLVSPWDVGIAAGVAAGVAPRVEAGVRPSIKAGVFLLMCPIFTPTLSFDLSRECSLSPLKTCLPE